MEKDRQVFRHRVKVLQSFSYIRYYSKQQWKEHPHLHEQPWEDYRSQSGYVENGELYLPQHILQDPDAFKCRLITLEDEAHFQPTDRWGNPQEPTRNACVMLSGRSNYKIFRLVEAEHLEVHLVNSYYNVGEPMRGDFKLANLREGKPVEILINGKIDNTATQYRSRLYKVQQYIFEYLGEFTEFNLLRLPYNPRPKPLPAERQVVDLQKRLY